MSTQAQVDGFASKHQTQKKEKRNKIRTDQLIVVCYKYPRED